VKLLNLLDVTEKDMLDLPLAVSCFLGPHNLGFSCHRHKCSSHHHSTPALFRYGPASVGPSLQHARVVEISCLSISPGLDGFCLGVEAFHCTFPKLAFCLVLHSDHEVVAPVLSNGSAWTKPEVRRSIRLSGPELVGAGIK
jgi:hypothetical protein